MACRNSCFMSPPLTQSCATTDCPSASVISWGRTNWLTAAYLRAILAMPVGGRNNKRKLHAWIPDADFRGRCFGAGRLQQFEDTGRCVEGRCQSRAEGEQRSGKERGTRTERPG